MKRSHDGENGTSRFGVLIALALVVGAIVLAGTALGRGTASEPSALHVPGVLGLTATKAADRLARSGLGATFRYEPAAANRCRVFAQDPAVGAPAAAGDQITLRCRARVPHIARGLAAPAALQELADGGFLATVVNPPHDGDTTRCRVRAQSRAGRAEPGTHVGLHLTCLAPPA